MTLAITILGCASSGGVPRVAYGWGACDPAEPKNRRRRCSILVQRSGQGGVTSVLVDAGPDLREQLLSTGLASLDAVLLTHDHADHVHGIDDVRPMVIAMRRRMPVYADEATAATLRARFGYCLESPPGSPYPPILEERRIRAGEPVTVDGPGGAVTGMPFDMQHGPTTALGFRFGDIAYASDVSRMPEAALAQLDGLEILIVDALRYTPHPTHFSVSDALDLIRRVRPRRTVLTNLHTDLDYATLAAELPAGIEPAFDGMTLMA